MCSSYQIRVHHAFSGKEWVFPEVSADLLVKELHELVSQEVRMPPWRIRLYHWENNRNAPALAPEQRLGDLGLYSMPTLFLLPPTVSKRFVGGIEDGLFLAQLEEDGKNCASRTIYNFGDHSYVVLDFFLDERGLAGLEIYYSSRNLAFDSLQYVGMDLLSRLKRCCGAWLSKESRFVGYGPEELDEKGTIRRRTEFKMDQRVQTIRVSLRDGHIKGLHRDESATQICLDTLKLAQDSNWFVHCHVCGRPIPCPSPKDADRYPVFLDAHVRPMYSATEGRAHPVLFCYTECRELLSERQFLHLFEKPREVSPVRL